MIIRKRDILHFLVLLLCITFFNKSSVAQHHQISFKHLSTVDGLSNFTVLSIAEDQQGFMWFGTMDGLNRFDGKQIRTYRADKNDPYSIGNNWIHALLCTSDSGMWVGTSRGLYYYDYYHDNFHHIPIEDKNTLSQEELEIKTLIADDTFLWIGTSSGLFRYDLVSKVFVSYLDAAMENTVIMETVEIIHKSNDGTIWIGGKEGLFYYRNRQLRRVANDSKLKYTQETNVISLNSDDEGRIWFGTLDQQTGLLIYDPKTEKFTDLNNNDGFIPHNKVNRIYYSKEGKIWAGTTWGLAIIDQQTFASRHIMYERENPDGISHNSIRAIFQGNNEILWIGTYSGGVNYFDKRSQWVNHVTNKYKDHRSLSFNIVSSIFEDKNRDLWVGTEYGGLNIYRRSNQRYEVIKSDSRSGSLLSDNIKSIVEDDKGRKFVATQYGMSIYDPQTNSFFNIDDNPGPRGRLNFYGVLDFCKDNDGNIWIGTHKWVGISKISGPGYLLMYDIAKDTIHHYLPENEDVAIVQGGVNSMIYDSRRNMIWSGSDNGLTGFDIGLRKYLERDAFINVDTTFRGVVINDLYLDENDLLWIATFGEGLYVMDVNTYQIKKIDRSEGLTESSFYALIGDNFGNIWASVNAYLLKIKRPIKYNDRISRVERYGIQEGFPPQQYFRTAACKGADGMLYFGGDDGYIAFSPEQVENIVFYPSVVMLDVLIDGEPLELGSSKDDQFLNVGSQKKLSIAYDQSNFAIQFIAPNFINPENTWYQYQLSGIHDTWQDLGNSSTINFTELKAGDYDLKIRASSDPEDFKDSYTSVMINVAPPFWGKPAAYLIYLTIILILLYLFFSVAQKWERLNQNLKFEHLQREQEKEFNQQRIKFFTDISHELRTPLTLILAPLERIVQSNFGNAKIKNQLLLMLRNGERMLQLINQLLDLRKLETGHMQLKAAKGNIVRFVKEVSLSFRELAQSRNIDFQVTSKESKLSVWFDRDKFEIILFNLMSNALKFTPEDGKISIGITKVITTANSHDKEEISIAIENSGRGISEDQVGHIFERFYSRRQGSEPKKAGSGVGLEIVKNLVELHKGNIAVESRFDDQGMNGVTKFDIRLPCGKGHLDKDELQKNYKSSEDINNYTIPVEFKDIQANEGKAINQSNALEKDGRILVIEDNSEVRMLVASVFDDDYQVLQAKDGKEGLELVMTEMPDLVISDVMMPEIDGIELCRRIKTDINTSHIPVILLTARTAVTFKYEGLETGADDYIVKPFNVEGLRLRAINLIKQRRLLKDKFSKSGLVMPTEVSLTSVDEKLLQATIDYVLENIEQKELTVDVIAKNVGMSRTNFYRKVKALTGMSASEFIRKIKMDRAAQLLKTNKIRVSEVGYMVGISDADYFRSCFKKQFGLTPKAFMESN